jgi:hypothetical protein
MTPEYIIADISVKFLNARNPLEEYLFYSNNNTWTRKLTEFIMYADSNSAVEIAKKLQLEEGLPKKVFLLQKQGNTINIGEVKF